MDQLNERLDKIINATKNHKKCDIDCSECQELNDILSKLKSNAAEINELMNEYNSLVKTIGK